MDLSTAAPAERAAWNASQSDTFLKDLNSLQQKTATAMDKDSTQMFQLLQPGTMKGDCNVTNQPQVSHTSAGKYTDTTCLCRLKPGSGKRRRRLGSTTARRAAGISGGPPLITSTSLRLNVFCPLERELSAASRGAQVNGVES